MPPGISDASHFNRRAKASADSYSERQERRRKPLEGWSGRADLNCRPPGPKPGALPLGHAPTQAEIGEKSQGGGTPQAYHTANFPVRGSTARYSQRVLVLPKSTVIPASLRRSRAPSSFLRPLRHSRAPLVIPAKAGIHWPNQAVCIRKSGIPHILDSGFRRSDGVANSPWL